MKEKMSRLSPFVSVLLPVLIVTGCGSLDSNRSLDESGYSQQEGFSFIVAADPQLFRGQKDDLDKAIASINELEPAFVVMCGDLVETPSNQQQIAAYTESVSHLKPTIGLYNMPGNHDLGRPVAAEHIAAYQENFGPLWYHFKYGNTVFVILASDILRDPDAPMHEEHTVWLRRVLREMRAATFDHLFIFMHHPLYIHSPDEPDNYSNMPVEIRRTLLNLFAEHRVQAVFSGHLHRNRINRYPGMDLIITNSITVPMGEDADAAGFRIVDVHRDRYEHRYHEVRADSSGQANASIAADQVRVKAVLNIPENERLICGSD
jgi:3',5'-cyclic AMP phosphodiesterase CpdA